MYIDYNTDDVYCVLHSVVIVCCCLVSSLSEGKEVAAMNNYCGIGLDAKITYEFHTRREENPGQYTLVDTRIH